MQPDHLGAGAGAEVARAIAFTQTAFDRLPDYLGFGAQAERMLEQHRRGQDGGERIGLVAARDIRGAAVNRLEQPDAASGGVELVAERGRRQQAHRSRQHRGFVGQDVAEHVLGDDHVEVARPADEMHRHRVDQHVLESDVLEFGADLAGDLAPQPRGGQDVGLVDRGQALAALARELEGVAQHADDFLLA